MKGRFGIASAMLAASAIAGCGALIGLQDHELASSNADASVDATAVDASAVDGSNLDGTMRDAAADSANLVDASDATADSAGLTDARDAAVVTSTFGCDSDSGLIGYWSFDEGEGGIAHDCTGLLNGTLFNSPQWITGRRDSGSALSFFPDAAGAPYTSDVLPYVDFGTKAVFQLAGAFTLSAWIYRDNANQGPQGQIFVGGDLSDPTDNNGGKGWVFENSPSGVTFQLGESDAFPLVTSPLTTGWHHVAAVFVPFASITLYVDGHFADQALTDSGTPQMPVPSSIGGSPESFVVGTGVTLGGFWGYLDELRLFSRPLSAAEVAVLAGE